jgi:hypothetical protein
MTYVPAELRRQVIERAGNCCEYCLIPAEETGASFHIEHIVALSHDGLTQEDNLALSCPACNYHKGSNIAGADPETGAPTFLFHPRLNLWDEHFSLSGGIIVPLTAEGRVTVRLLRLNDNSRVIERKGLAEFGLYPCQRD